MCVCVLGQWKLPLNLAVPLHAWLHYLKKNWEPWSVENDLEKVEKHSEGIQKYMTQDSQKGPLT